MSIYYKESNNEEIAQIFNKKIIYYGEMTRLSPKNVVNFHFGEKYLYGRVSVDSVPMIFKSQKGLKRFTTKTNKEDLKAVNFVVDNFEAMAQRFRKHARMGLIDKDDQYLSDLKVYKAYEDPTVLYTNYVRAYFKSVASVFRQENSNIINFEQFINALNSYLEATTNSKLPFTMPAFIKSRLCPLSVSGLVIEIADLKHSNDDQKIQQFVNSKNWDFYANTCNTYGFMIDMNAPWRLVADLDTVSMLSYAAKYKMPNIYSVFMTLYRSPAYRYFNKLKFDLLRLYNTIKPTQATFDDGCTRRIITPVEYTSESLDEIFGEEYFLKLYFNIRFMEEESKFTDAEKNRLISEAIQVYRTHGKGTTIAIFESILNKTFDYRGSLSYIINAINKMKAEQEGLDSGVTESTYEGIMTGGGY